MDLKRYLYENERMSESESCRKEKEIWNFGFWEKRDSPKLHEEREMITVREYRVPLLGVKREVTLTVKRKSVSAS